jgi:hypothetical protein
MKADVELCLSHDGWHWVARNPAFFVKGDTLHALDERLRISLLDTGDFPPGSRVTVFMGFDFDTIPIWLRQYHSHYFNRFLTLEL